MKHLTLNIVERIKLNDLLDQYKDMPTKRRLMNKVQDKLDITQADEDKGVIRQVVNGQTVGFQWTEEAGRLCAVDLDVEDYDAGIVSSFLESFPGAGRPETVVIDAVLEQLKK